MEWQNYLSLLRDKLSAEALLLVASLSWVLLRGLSLINGRIKKGERLKIKVFGHEFIEIKGRNSNSALRHTGKNT